VIIETRYQIFSPLLSALEVLGIVVLAEGSHVSLCQGHADYNPSLNFLLPEKEIRDSRPSLLRRWNLE
jgi:hypothetical protein